MPMHYYVFRMEDFVFGRDLDDVGVPRALGRLLAALGTYTYSARSVSCLALESACDCVFGARVNYLFCCWFVGRIFTVLTVGGRRRRTNILHKLGIEQPSWESAGTI